MFFAKNVKFNFFFHLILLHLIFACYYCSIDLKRHSASTWYEKSCCVLEIVSNWFDAWYVIYLLLSYVLNVSFCGLHKVGRMNFAKNLKKNKTLKVIQNFKGFALMRTVLLSIYCQFDWQIFVKLHAICSRVVPSKYYY